MDLLKVTLYALCVVSSLACTVMLFRGYLQRRYRLLLWSAVCFTGLTVNNLLLFADLVVFPFIDMRIGRLVAALLSILAILYAFIWEAD
jgi:hypothetical protein